jgi:threonine aldolase
MAPPTRGFASDNSAAIHPAVLEAITAANSGHAFGYGHDEWTARAERLFAQQFGSEALAYLVWGGTAANVLSLRATCRRWEAVICADSAHMNVDEAGAPEAIAGIKLLPVESEHGKLGPEQVEQMIVRVGDEHAVQPRLVSISQSTELGSVYRAEEVAALSALAHERGLLLHMDGARLANAAAALELPLRALSTDVGVDLLSFGATKNGALGAEAVVFLNPSLADGFQYLRKQSLQLASKMRFLAAQFDGLLSGELWRELARHSNEMARQLAAALHELPDVEITRPVEANAVFAILPRPAISRLLEQFKFYVWDERRDEVRWMCSWDTTEEDVAALAEAVRAAVGRQPVG